MIKSHRRLRPVVVCLWVSVWPDSTWFVSAALRLRHASRADGFTVVSVWTCSRSAAYRLRPAPAGRSLQNRYAGAGRSTSADRKSHTEATIWHPDTFQNKTLRVDTSTPISKQWQTQALLLILRPGTLPVVVFITAVAELVRLVTPADDWTQTGEGFQTADGGAKPEQSCNAADVYLVESQDNEGTVHL